MLKKGDVIYGATAIILVILIALSILPVPMSILRNVALIGFAILFIITLGIISLTAKEMNEAKDPFFHSPTVNSIIDLIAHAEMYLEQDIDKSIEAYNKIKHMFRSLERHEKSIVLKDSMDLYLKIHHRTAHKKHKTRK